MPQLRRGDAMVLAQQACTCCMGLGVRMGRGSTETPCNCVFRAIFRTCFARFKRCAAAEKYIARVDIEKVGTGRNARTRSFGFKTEEYMADFVLIARRVLNEADYQLFRFHFLLGADWKACSRRLGIDRGTFFHRVYRVQQRLGKAYAGTEPYGLYPVDEYFSGTIAQAHSRAAAAARDRSTEAANPICFLSRGAASPIGKRDVIRFPIKTKAAA